MLSPLLSSEDLRTLYPKLLRAAASRYRAIVVSMAVVALLIGWVELVAGIMFALLALAYWLVSRRRLPSIGRATLSRKLAESYRNLGMEYYFDFHIESLAMLDGKGGLRGARATSKPLRLRVDKAAYDAEEIPNPKRAPWIFLMSYDDMYLGIIEAGKLDDRDWF
jgi:hypothetical protein